MAISAVKAFRLLDTGLPEANALVAAQIKAGTVSKVFKGDLDAMKKVSAKYMKWLTENNLISTDAKLAAPKGVRGGGTGSDYGKKIEAIVGADFVNWKALHKKINATLVEKKSTLRVFSYCKDEAFTKAPPVAAAPVVPATK